MVIPVGFVGPATHGLISLGDLPEEQRQEILQECASVNCRQAKDALQPARNAIFLMCTQIATKESQRMAAAVAAAGLWTAVTATAFAVYAAASIPGTKGGVVDSRYHRSPLVPH